MSGKPAKTSGGEIVRRAGLRVGRLTQERPPGVSGTISEVVTGGFAAAGFEAATGIRSSTITRFLWETKQSGGLRTGTVVVVDEAGMVGSRHLVFDDTGAAYEIDSLNHRILSLDANDQVVAELFRLGDDHGDVNYPLHVVPLPGNGMLVLDHGNSRLQLFQRDDHPLPEAYFRPVDGPY